MRRTPEEAAQTRAALLDAALFTFAEQGVPSTKLADVAQRAGVTRGAVYHHFADKADLYAAVIAESWDTVTAPVWAALEGEAPLESRLSGFLVSWLRRLREDARFRALLTLTLNASYAPALDESPRARGSSASREAKAFGLADWQGRLGRTLAGAGPSAQHGGADGAGATATHLLAWLCGTAMLAAADPGLLPPADASGVAPVIRGALG
ncbi:TetR family transcriptional regulator [Streptomyces orinoci]|uniref:TetR family transcriptional regulator n=1 Tax=Streptomyces orinoci TaxID=67339 RepID=A0ABV3JQQ3_STRON|nr:TetR family transcriptional regulator [Streptomyces orinoci]